MKPGLFRCVVVLSLCGASKAPCVELFDSAERGILQVVHGYKLDETGPNRTPLRVDWMSDVQKWLPVVVDVFDTLSDKGNDEKEQSDEQEAQQQQEEAQRQRQRAEQAERNEAAAREEARWLQEEAQREAQRADQAERDGAAAREEAQQSRQLAEEAKGTAEEAKGVAEQARGTAEKAEGVAQEAKSISQQAQGAAQQAKGISQQAMGAAEEAQGVAQEAKDEAEQARGTAVDARIQVEAAHQRVGRQNTFVALLALLTLLTMILAMRKPRRTIVRVAGNALEPLSRRFRPAAARGVAKETASVVLTGFDSRGRAVTIPLPAAELDPKSGGFTLGRHHLLVDRALDDERVSKRHVRFSYDGHGYFVEDLNSTNGTVVNGGQTCPPFKPIPLRPGDTVRLGGLDLIVSA